MSKLISETKPSDQMPSTYNEKYLSILKEIILSIVDTEKVMVFSFGSRVSSRHCTNTDADIGLFSDDNIPTAVYHQIRNAIDGSIIPWDVDIIDFTRVDPMFKKEATKDIVIWNKPTAMKKSLTH